MWVDESERVVVEIAARSTGRVKIKGGLAGLRDLEFTFGDDDQVDQVIDVRQPLTFPAADRNPAAQAQVMHVVAGGGHFRFRSLQPAQLAELRDDCALEHDLEGQVVQLQGLSRKATTTTSSVPHTEPPTGAASNSEADIQCSLPMDDDERALLLESVRRVQEKIAPYV